MLNSDPHVPAPAALHAHPAAEGAAPARRVRHPISAFSALSALIPIASAALLVVAVASVVEGFRIPLAVPIVALAGIIVLSILMATTSRGIVGRDRAAGDDS